MGFDWSGLCNSVQVFRIDLVVWDSGDRYFFVRGFAGLSYGRVLARFFFKGLKLFIIDICATIMLFF